MAKMVDARGLACPQPVIQTRKAMHQADHIVTLVDNDTALTNVSRMAAKAGWQVDVTDAGNEFRIEMSRPSETVAVTGDTSAQSNSLQVGKVGLGSGPLVLVISATTMGRGNAELGSILIRGFFHSLEEVDPHPQTLIFFNEGVKLACEGSPVLEDLRALEDEGIELLVCGTCLGYFEIKDKLAVGQVSNMYDIADTMLHAGRVVNL